VEQVLLIGTPGTAAGDALQDAYAGIVDRYGQYTRGRWPEKIDSDAALRAAHARERARRAVAPACGETGPASARGAASGGFRTRRVDGRWQLVAPDGRA